VEGEGSRGKARDDEGAVRGEPAAGREVMAKRPAGIELADAAGGEVSAEEG
jgi:hypothetical protein